MGRSGVEQMWQILDKGNGRLIVDSHDLRSAKLKVRLFFMNTCVTSGRAPSVIYGDYLKNMVLPQLVIIAKSTDLMQFN